MAGYCLSATYIASQCSDLATRSLYIRDSLTRQLRARFIALLLSSQIAPQCRSTILADSRVIIMEH